jgi:hypothetical protein
MRAAGNNAEEAEEAEEAEGACFKPNLRLFILSSRE